MKIAPHSFCQSVVYFNHFSSGLQYSSSLWIIQKCHIFCILKYQPWKYKRTGELVHKLQKENRDYELQLNFVGLDNPG